jgi:hypothetical protein
LNVDLSEVQAKPDSAPVVIKESPRAAAPESTPESPAPQVLPKDAEADIDQTVKQRAAQGRAGLKVKPSSGGKQAVLYPVPEDRDVIEVKIAAGSEKRGWLEAAAERFMADPSLQQHRRQADPADHRQDRLDQVRRTDPRRQVDAERAQ